jgi:hypothetical protein
MARNVGRRRPKIVETAAGACGVGKYGTGGLGRFADADGTCGKLTPGTEGCGMLGLLKPGMFGTDIPEEFMLCGELPFDGVSMY